MVSKLRLSMAQRKVGRETEKGECKVLMEALQSKIVENHKRGLADRGETGLERPMELPPLLSGAAF
jgi:hypothetical protein